MKAEIKNNGKPFYPAQKLMIGIVLFASFFIINYFIGGVDGLTKIKHSLRDGVLNGFPKDLIDILLSLFGVAVGIFMVYAFVSGLYRICTFNQYIPTFEDKFDGGIPVIGNSAYPNINTVLSYRESRLAGMSPEDGADLYIASSKIDSLCNGSYNIGPNTKSTLSFIESKLAGMSPDRGLNYLANKL